MPSMVALHVRFSMLRVCYRQILVLFDIGIYQALIHRIILCVTPALESLKAERVLRRHVTAKVRLTTHLLQARVPRCRRLGPP